MVLLSIIIRLHEYRVTIAINIMSTGWCLAHKSMAMITLCTVHIIELYKQVVFVLFRSKKHNRLHRLQARHITYYRTDNENIRVYYWRSCKTQRGNNLNHSLLRLMVISIRANLKQKFNRNVKRGLTVESFSRIYSYYMARDYWSGFAEISLVAMLIYVFFFFLKWKRLS